MINFLQLSDQSFNTFVDGLGSDKYRQLVESDPDFRDRVNGNTAWQERRDQETLEAFVTQELQKKKDRLNQELDRGRGLSTASWIWLDQKNLNTVSLSVPPSVREIRPVYDTFNKKRGPFTEDERGTLLTISQQCAPFGRALDLRDMKSWECVFAIATLSGRISVARTQPVEEKPAVKPEPTPEKKKAQEIHDRFNKIVGTWVDKGVTKKETAATIDAMDSETYKRFIIQTKGNLERRMSHLLHPVTMGVK